MGDAAVLDMKGQPITPKPKQRKERETINGPFATQHRALLFWDRIIGGDPGGGLFDCISEADNRLDEYAVHEGRFQNRGGHYPIVENDLYLQTKGR